MAIDLSKAPYLDRFSSKNQWTRVNFLGDRSLQASELNEAQSILHHYVGKLGDSIMIDGDIQDGMDFFIDSDGDINVEDGEVYYGGKVRKFNKSSIPFDEEAEEFKVCIALEDEIIDEEDDDSLLDQNTGTPNYFSPGAHRLKETLYLTSDEDIGVPIYEFREGQLHLNKPANRELSKINEILAERTYDESGSYRVNGLEIRGEEHEDNETKINIIVESGRAYVLGYQIDKPTSVRIAVPKAREKKDIQSEGFVYRANERRGRLGNSPVSNVRRVTGRVQITKERVSRSSVALTPDKLANSSVVTVDKIWTESDGDELDVYVRGEDYQLIDGDAIEWISGGNSPSSGISYYVNYQYNLTMKKDTDYKVVEEGSIDERRSYIDFNGLSGSKPIEGSTVIVDYEYFLAREDLVIMDKDGNIFVEQGQPNSLSRVKRPRREDPFTLQLGSILLYPDSNTTIPHKSTITRLTMQDLQNMKNRINNLEYNEAVNALDQPAMGDENPLVLRGVFSDGFISTEKYDSGHPDARVGFSFDDAEITLPYASSHKNRPGYLEDSSIAHTWGRLVTAPFDEERSIHQPAVTNTMNVNPYHVFNAVGMLKLDPSEDSWIDEEKVTVVEEDEETLQMRRWWGTHINDPWVDDEIALASSIDFDDGYELDGTVGTREELTGKTGIIIKNGGQRVNEAKSEFMRRIKVNFKAKNLRPNDDNFVMNFDGKITKITAAEGFTKGTRAGSIRSNAKGEAEGSFTVPEGIRTGTREVTLENEDNLATTTYTAQGMHRKVEDVILKTRVTINNFDPLAQSFQFRENKVVTSFDAYFASKDNTKNMIVQVRGISEGGQPNKTIYAESILTPSQVKVSDDATKATNISFDDPLVVNAGKEYAVVFLTDSDQYTMWIATRGENDLVTDNRVTANPYIEGVLYSSSNASAWTIHQDSDLKFSVYTARFNDKAVVEFDDMSDVSGDALVLMATTLTPDNTGSIWDIKIVMDSEPEDVTLDDKDWMPIEDTEQKELDGLARAVKLRAIFKANRNMSPIMSLNDLLLTTFLSELSGSYVSRTIDATDSEFNNVKISYDAFTPGNTTVTPRYSTDGGDTWSKFESDPVTTALTDEFTKYEFDEVVKDDEIGYDSIKFRLDLTTQNSFIRPRVRRFMSRWTME